MPPPARRAAALLFLALAPAIASPAPAAEPFTACAGCPPMVLIPPGRVVIGDDHAHAKAERPAVSVVIARPFALGRTEVTFDQWEECVAAGACRGGQDDHGWGRGQRPVINVPWDDARAFAAWIGARSGLVCRLPGEAEWEYAARAGSRAGFWWGESPGKNRANCRDCLGREQPYGTSPAGRFAPNPWGLFDMNGNVWEWTETCWSPDHAARVPETCADRVIKGGSWYYFSPMARASARARADSRAASYTLGFRVLCEPAAAGAAP